MEIIVNGIPYSSPTLTSPTINGTIATTGLTLPAVTLGGALTLNGQVFDAGSGSAQINTTGANAGLIMTSTQDGATGVLLRAIAVSTSPAVSDLLFQEQVMGKNDNAETITYGTVRFLINSPTDGAEDSKYDIYLYNAGAQNQAMTLSGAGVLAVDLGGSGAAAQVDLFDEYDDAIVIKQGIQQNNRELLADIGVFDRKDTGSGYMMKIQPMVRLLAGGIYQSRQRLDDLIDILVSEFPQVTERLIERKLIGG